MIGTTWLKLIHLTKISCHCIKRRSVRCACNHNSVDKSKAIICAKCIYACESGFSKKFRLTIERRKLLNISFLATKAAFELLFLTVSTWRHDSWYITYFTRWHNYLFIQKIAFVFRQQTKWISFYSGDWSGGSDLITKIETHNQIHIGFWLYFSKRFKHRISLVLEKKMALILTEWNHIEIS